MASSNIARLGVVLGLDMAEFKANVDAAISEAGKLKNEIKRHSEAAVKELYALTNATNDYGKELTKVEQIQREIDVGRFASATKDMKDRLLAQAAAYDAKVAAEKKSFDAGKLTMAQQQALAFQTTDLVTQIASGQNAMIALLQQGGQLKDSMGGFSNMFKVLAAQITPFRVGIATVVAALGTLAFAFYRGSEESKRLRDDMILTGNYAGMAQKRFFELSDTVASKLNVSVGESKTVFSQLVASGKFTQESIKAVGEAILRVADLSGKGADQVAQELIPAFDGSAASAKSLNDKMHFLTLEQYKQIETLEKQNRKQEAAKVLADALNKSLSGQTRELGQLESVMRDVTEVASKFWNALLNLGRMGDLESRIEDITTQIKTIKTVMDFMPQGEILGDLTKLTALEQLLEKLQQQKKEKDEDEARKRKNTKLIEDEAKYGAKRRQLAGELEDQITKNRYQNLIQQAGAEEQILLESAEKVELLTRELKRKNAEDAGVFAVKNAEIFAAQVAEIEMDTNEKLRQMKLKSEASTYEEILRMQIEETAQTKQRFADAALEVNKRIAAENEGLVVQREQLELQQKSIGLMQKDKDIAESRLRLMQQIREIQRDFSLSDEDKAGIIGRLTDQQAIREQNIALIDSIKKVEQVYDSVFGNMMNAIERFVRTGKMSFRDLARSIIQDLIMIQIRAQATALFSMLMGNVGAAFRYGTNIGSQQTSMLAAQEVGMRASGGPVGSNQPYIVGERGPELFIPRGAGTIVPNNAMASMSPTSVTNNYINAIDVKSFEDRLLGSANTIWAANLYAQKRLPLGTGRM